jgi:hypothetical protein
MREKSEVERYGESGRGAVWKKRKKFKLQALLLEAGGTSGCCMATATTDRRHQGTCACQDGALAEIGQASHSDLQPCRRMIADMILGAAGQVS